jgi:protein gp37
MQTTNIEWADWTWNPVRGCSRISPGCMNCYAELDMARKNENPKVPGCHGYSEFRIVGGGRREAHWTGKVELIESKLLEPLSWRKKALKFAREHGRKPRVFISMSDLFHERLPDEAIDSVFAVAALCPEMNFLFLTKRAERMAVHSYRRFEHIAEVISNLRRSRGETGIGAIRWPLPNVWLGVSVEDQKRADERIDHLRRTPAAVRFLSIEPQLEEIRVSLEGIDWVICGGESGAHARPFDLAWARSLRDQRKAAGVAFFMKQAGSLPHDSEKVLYGVGPYGPAKEGLEPVWLHLKDKKGGDPAEWPEDLRIQEVPDGTN